MARQFQSDADLKRAVGELLDFKDSFLRGSLNMHGNKIVNTGKATSPDDVVTLRQLPQISQTDTDRKQSRTIIFCKEGYVKTTDIIPAYRFGRGMESLPLEVWLECRVLPETESLIIRLKYKLNKDTDAIDLLDEDLEIVPGAEEGVKTSTFSAPLIKFGRDSLVYPEIIQTGGDGEEEESGAAAAVTIGIVVERLI